MATTQLTGNNLLDQLAIADRLVVMEHAREIEIRSGHVLYHPGDDVQACYFPRFASVASFHVVMAEGAGVETAIVGREGAVGGIVSHGRLPAFARASVMSGGSFYRIASSDLEKAKERSPAMRNLFARYADCLLAQIFQSVACNASHTIEQRAAKWLLAASDRTGQADVMMTQEQIGSVLGVGRTYVSRVMSRFKERGVLANRRGVVVMRDIAQLRELSCDCNELVAEHFDTVLRGVYPSPDDGNGAEPMMADMAAAR